MRVIICGAGQVGYGIAERLAAENHDITVIDTEAKLIEKIRDTLDVRCIIGHGSRPEVLLTAGADEADMLIAVTLFDEVNMVACQVAHSLFNIPTKIARIRSQSYLEPRYKNLFARENIPIDVVISPEVEVGEMVMRRITLPGAIDVLYFCNDAVVALALECMEDCPVINTPLKQLTELFPDLQTTVTAIKRDSELLIAHSDTQLRVGDITYLVSSRDQVRRALRIFGHKEQEAHRIIIAGGGHIGLYVAQAIEKRLHKLKLRIIEADKERALTIADQLEKTAILYGNVLDPIILQEAGIGQADLMITLTNQDQVNLLSAIIAKRLGCKANMVLINNVAYQEFSRAVGVDAYFNPRSVTVSKILQQMRRGRIRAVHSVFNGAAEIIEAEAMQTSSLIGKPLRELNLPEGLRISAIYRNETIIQLLGDTRILPGDRIVIFALADSVRDVEQLFRVSLEYF
ncbi:potassium uptake protein TrkA [Bartonella clarridgeiae 73]|uniref:Trk system potassium uptake protein TrkA n=1 Tax=Bartonella clarridgeiae (strain CCUG 45776 / CIP 104772 / 73) TaxID=696125 RepID=E6YHE7_BARC7|nr:Trk system potassium transporter TrkA [Bartonella clarridgeiae]WCR55137.1 MAG: Trk potassium uptake system protein TrkA [Bartonella clarridgeiae]CBI76285.1 potassium uptake protein TrkA [Bartonella clarridgeiae 73]